VVCGRGTGGSAKAVLPEPIWRSCAAAMAESNTSSEKSVAANFEKGEVVTGSLQILVHKKAEFESGCAAKSRAGKGV